MRDLPSGWERDGRWARLLEAMGTVADPDAALRRLVALGPEVVEGALASPPRAQPLLAVLGFSDYLSAILARTPGLARELAGGPQAPRGGLRAFKDAELVRIAARDLARAPSRQSFVATGQALADLADACLSRALEVADPSVRLAVMAMGKYGGRELNYASDIDVLFVYRGGDHERAQRAARAVMQVMQGVFRVDADLRPEGRDGPLARSLDAYASYYARWARVWELQALIKCRFAAGDAEVGRDFLDLVRRHLWEEPLAPQAIEEVRALKARAEREAARRAAGRREVKRGPGGIRDVEFAVQLLQLVHGRHRPELRAPATLDALDALGAEGFVAEADAAELAEAYVFLRHVEHRLQLVGGRQTHTLPARRADLEHIARGLAYRDGPQRSALEAFEEDWRRTTAVVRRIHERLFYRPLLEVFAGPAAVGPHLGPEQAAERLAALGFDRPARALRAIAELTAGASRRAKVMRAVLPGVLAWLAEAPDPDAGLVRLASLAARLDAYPHLLAVLRDEPPVAELLCRAVGTGPVLAALLEREPGLVTALTAPLRTPERPALVREARAVVGRAPDAGAAASALRRLKEAEWLRAAVRDLAAGEAPEVFVEVGRHLSVLADACLQAALDLARAEADARYGGPPPGGFAVIGLGRLGGEELNHASDLDVIFVYERDGVCPDGTEGRLYHAAVAERLMEILSATPPIFRVDAELRPEGRSGPLVRSLASCQQYYERWASTWEFQALIRARHAAGDEAVTARLAEVVAPRVWPERLGPKEVAEIRHIKARIERERVKGRQDPRLQVKLGYGGLADVEFTVQLLQMRHGHHHPELRTPNTLRAIDALRGAGIVGEVDATWLRDAYLLLNRVRNHLFLLRGLATDALPGRDEDLERLARSLGYERPGRSRFLEDYRRVTRRARRVCDRLFYGEEGES